MFKKAKDKKGYSGQTATELAIFGSMLVFVLGILISYALNNNFSQQLPFQAFRKATQFSAIIPTNVAIIEDRGIPNVGGPLAIPESTGTISTATATLGNNLFVKWNYEDKNIVPLLRLYINGKLYSLTNAGFREYALGNSVGGCPNGYLPKKIAFNDPSFKPGGSNINIPVPGVNFWQWLCIQADTQNINVDPTTKKNVELDVDGDGKEENILSIVASDACTYYPCREDPDSINCQKCIADSNCLSECCQRVCDACVDPNYDCCPGSCGTRCRNRTCADGAACYGFCLGEAQNCCKANAIAKVSALDYQEGDIDNTIDSNDIANGKLRQGLTLGAEQTNKKSTVDRASLRKQEDENKIINTVNLKRTDVIERIIQLNCHLPTTNTFVLACNDRSGPGGTCCCSENVKAQAGGDGICNPDKLANHEDCCDASTGELHVFSKQEYKRNTTWTTPH